MKHYYRSKQFNYYYEQEIQTPPASQISGPQPHAGTQRPRHGNSAALFPPVTFFNNADSIIYSLLKLLISSAELFSSVFYHLLSYTSFSLLVVKSFNKKSISFLFLKFFGRIFFRKLNAKE